jgi:hypothetical protein
VFAWELFVFRGLIDDEPIFLKKSQQIDKINKSKSHKKNLGMYINKAYQDIIIINFYYITSVIFHKYCSSRVKFLFPKKGSKNLTREEPESNIL